MTSRENADKTLASIDSVLSFYSAGLGKDLAVPVETDHDYDPGARFERTPEREALDEQIGMILGRRDGRLEDLNPAQMRRFIEIQRPEWLHALAESLDEVDPRAAAWVRRVEIDKWEAGL